MYADLRRCSHQFYGLLAAPRRQTAQALILASRDDLLSTHSSVYDGTLGPDAFGVEEGRWPRCDLDFREFCARRKLPMSSTPQLEQAWNAVAAERYRRGETDARPTRRPTRSNRSIGGCNAYRGMSENLSVPPL